MNEVLKVNACVYSRKGYEREINRDDFYMNGKFLSEHHIDNVEASMENRGAEYLFAVSDHMEFSDDEQRASFSILREMGRFHEKITVHEGDLAFKTKELSSRVLETGKYLESFLDMKNAPPEDQARQMGFAGVLLTEGKAVAATYGTSHVYYCRGEVFRHMTDDRAKPQRLVELGIISDEEAGDFEEKYHAAEEEKTGEVSITDPVDLQEGDKFLLISDGIYNAVGEEYLEDILSMRSDSTYIAYRILSEALKRSSDDDMTAMVVCVEKITVSGTGSSGVIKKTAERPKTSSLKNTPPPTYKYTKKNIRKYENIIYRICVVLTAILLITICILVVRNIMDKIRDVDDGTPTPTVVTATPSPTTTPTEEEPTETTPTAATEPMPAQTQAEAEIKEHVVVKGDTLSSIARKYYGDNYAYVERLGMYNKIPAPYDSIIVGQKIKIPPKEVLQQMN